MLLYEYQAKALVEQEGVPIPSGFLADGPEELVLRLQELKFPVFLKAQVLSGGRGKAGGIRMAKTPSEALGLFSAIKSMDINTTQNAGKRLSISTILIEEGQALSAELYMAIVMDRSRSTPVLIASRKGGMEIEEVAAREPDAILKIDLDPSRIVPDHICRRVHFFLGNPKINIADTTKVIRGLFNTFLKNDALLVEINPLCVTELGKLIALDAKMSLDENACFRHDGWSPYLPQNIMNPEEEEAAKFGLSYIKLDGGKIGCMVNGAGLAMATMDLISLYGGKPANFLDVGGRATIEGTTEAFKILHSDSGIKTVLVNIFGGIVQCDLIAQGILAASENVDIDIPLVIRLEGTNADKGLSLIKESGKPWFVARDLSEAVRLAVDISEKP